MPQISLSIRVGFMHRANIDATKHDLLCSRRCLRISQELFSRVAIFTWGFRGLTIACVYAAAFIAGACEDRRKTRGRSRSWHTR